MVSHLTPLLEADNRLQKSFREAEKTKPEGTTAGSALAIMSTAGPDSAFQVVVTKVGIFSNLSLYSAFTGSSVCYQR